MKKAIEWRMKTRQFLEQALACKYMVREVVFSPDQQRIFFKLNRE